MKKGGIICSNSIAGIDLYYKIWSINKDNVLAITCNGSIVLLEKCCCKKPKMATIRLNKVQSEALLYGVTTFKHSLCTTWLNIFNADIVCVLDETGRNQGYYRILDARRCIKRRTVKSSPYGTINVTDLYVKLTLGHKIY